MNGVREDETNNGKCLSPGRCTTEQQGGPGDHFTTAKGGRRRTRKWFHEVNRIVVEIKESMRVRESQYVCLKNLNKMAVKFFFWA